jgi:hypothetical protein
MSRHRPMKWKLSFQRLPPLARISFLWLPKLLTHIVAKNLVLDLIQALQIEPAARILPFRIADRTLSGDLATLYSRVDSNQLDITLAIPLVKQIAGNERTWNDANIWGTVFESVYARTVDCSRFDIGDRTQQGLGYRGL